MRITTRTTVENPLVKIGRMQTSSVLFVLMSLLARVGGQNTEICYLNLTRLNDALQTADVSTQRTYTLCPNTVFDIGISTPFGECCQEESGQHPLVATPNTRFQCGSDGKSSNNCVIRGGTFQFQSVFSFTGTSFTTATVSNDNVQVAGITFESASNIGLRLSQAGDITFTDCIIRVSVSGKTEY
jgi:hypothetical protein